MSGRHWGHVIEGLTIERGEGGERAAKRSQSATLLAQHRALEITRHRIAAGKHFFLDEASEWSGFEFIYVLEGSLSLSDGTDKTPLRAGDYLHHRGLPQRAFFRVEEDVVLLMVSSPPSFHLVREEIQDIMALARSVEEKDRQTEGHCHRLERLAIRTGERLGLSGQRLVDLSYAAYLHDVGKIRVPDCILGKPGPLTDGEWVEMRRHTEYGGDMLVEKGFLRSAASIVAAHHENFDGTGYPRGLRGEEIPIEARIIAVVDAYDAMTSERPYQVAGGRSKAVQELRLNAGTQFDPRVVRAFLAVIGEEELA